MYVVKHSPVVKYGQVGGNRGDTCWTCALTYQARMCEQYFSV